jgi:hypothetical protein
MPLNPGKPGLPLESSIAEVCVVPAVKLLGGAVVSAGRLTGVVAAHWPAFVVSVASGAKTS